MSQEKPENKHKALFITLVQQFQMQGWVSLGRIKNPSSDQVERNLNMAVFLVDPKGDLLFYNEAAEEILGVRYSETGKMSVEEWSTVFKPSDENGNPLPPEALPLVQTLNDRKPAHGSIYIDNARSKRYMITITSFPIEGRTGDLKGCMALFWKNEEL